MPTSLQKIFLVIIFVKKGGPFHLISFGRKNYGAVNKGILYRRSKKIPKDQHWNETRLGEISTSWSYLCKSPSDVLYNSSKENLFERKSKLIDNSKKRVYLCDLDSMNAVFKENYPFCKTIELNNDLLKIEVIHNKTLCNYPHTDINCYLTTNDGYYIDELIEAKDWDQNPLNTRKFKGLKSNYKTHLLYHFAEHQDF